MTPCRIPPTACRNGLLLALTLVLACANASDVRAQADNPDFRIRSDFRAPSDEQWASHESVGHAEFRVKSRYGQVYYGGVIRMDDYKFTVQVDFREISDYESEFPGSAYDTNYDAYIENAYVGRVFMNSEELGLGELVYDSRHASPPDLPLPAAFPSPVASGMLVRVFHASGAAPAIGSPLPSGEPVFMAALVEASLRGDVDEDGEVDLADFAVLESNFDPDNLSGPHIGPAQGDFTGDNRSDLSDYATFVQNWTGDGDPPALGVTGVGPGLAQGGLRLGATQPNPFRTTATIPFSLASAADVTLEVFELGGQRVARRDYPGLAAGSHRIEFDGRSSAGRPLPAGTYFYRVHTGSESATRRIVRVN